MINLEDRKVVELERVADVFGIPKSAPRKAVLAQRIADELAADPTKFDLLDGMTKPQLKSLAQDLGLVQSGTNAELRTRIQDALTPTAPVPAVVSRLRSFSWPSMPRINMPRVPAWAAVGVVVIAAFVIALMAFNNATGGKLPEANTNAPLVEGSTLGTGDALAAEGEEVKVDAEAQKAAEEAARNVAEEAQKDVEQQALTEEQTQKDAEAEAKALEAARAAALAALPPYAQIDAGETLIQNWWETDERMVIVGIDEEAYDKEQCAVRDTILMLSSDPGDFVLADNDGDVVVTWSRMEELGYAAIVVLPENWSLNASTSVNELVEDPETGRIGRYNFWALQKCSRGDSVDDIAMELAEAWMLEQGKPIVVVVDSSQEVTEINREE